MNEFEDYLLGLPFPEYVATISFKERKITKIPSLMHLFPYLQILDLSRHNIVDITALSNLPRSLQELNLYFNDIVDITALTNLPRSLKQLNLCHNKIVDFTPLNNVPESLRWIDIRGNTTQDYSPVLSQIAYRYKLHFIRGPYSESLNKMFNDPNRKLRAVLFSLVQNRNKRGFQYSALRKLPLEIDFPLFRLVSKHLEFPSPKED